MAHGCCEKENIDCIGDMEERKMRCRAGKTSFWVTWNGKMLPCGMFSTDGYSISEIGFEHAWENVRKMTDAIRLPEKCSGCSSLQNCCVCAAACISETGKFDVVPEYICRMTKTYEKLIRGKYGKGGFTDENK